jgi:hypothetical protein
MTKEEILQEFKEYGDNASFHFADDSGREWQLAYADERKAREMLTLYPDLHEDFVKIAKGFLWSL